MEKQDHPGTDKKNILRIQNKILYYFTCVVRETISCIYFMKQKVAQNRDSWKKVVEQASTLYGL